jgi:nucleotide-binding universal stress UspA family protein
MIKAQEPIQATKDVTPIEKTVSLSKILVATDFSTVSERALEYAISLARHYDSRVYVAHVINPEDYGFMAPDLAVPSPTIERRVAKEKMDEVMAWGLFYGVPHEGIVKEGALWPAIEALIKQNRIDLLVVGTRGMGAVERIVIGSRAEQLFRQARIPVLTVGPAVLGEPFFEMEFKNILFATDFGPGAEREGAYASSLAREHRAVLTMLHVVSHGKRDSVRDAQFEQEVVLRQLKELVPAEPEGLYKLDFRVVNGESSEEILRMAKAIRADLIVMGAKKNKGVAGHAPRATAYRVVCGACAPVLTIRS